MRCLLPEDFWNGNMLIVFEYSITFLAILALDYEVELPWQILLKLFSEPLILKAWKNRLDNKDADID